MNACLTPIELLKDNGIKLTKQRMSILQILIDTNQPLDAEGIYERLRENLEGCNLSTVYRNMELLVNLNLVIESTMGQKAYFSLNQHEHAHYVQCLSCKQVVQVDGCPFEQYERQLAEKLGFKMLGHRVELFGICKKCSDDEH